jgi:hypothetical protein
MLCRVEGEVSMSRVSMDLDWSYREMFHRAFETEMM